MKIDYQDKIDNYLLDRMSEEERVAFEKDIEKDKELQEQSSFTRDVKQVLKSRNEKLAAMKEWKDDYVWENESMVTPSAEEYRPTGSGYNYCPAPSMDETRSKPRSSGRKFFYWISGIAAIFIVGFFLYDSIFVVYDANPPIQSEVVFKGAVVNDSIDIIMKEGDFSTVLTLIEKEEDEINDKIQFIEQEKALSKIDQEEYAELREELMYRLDGLSVNKAKALAGLGRFKEALSLLDKIRHSESDYQERADSLYQDVLKELR